VIDPSDSPIDPFGSALKRRQELVTELLDFRKMLEPPLAARAAAHASGDEIAEMEEILQRQEGKLLEERPLSPKMRNSITASRSLRATPWC
jgi:DNA-binding GntR family transcriptional regulator